MKDINDLLFNRLEKINDLHYKVQFLVDWMDSKGWLEDHCFCFNDGDIWYAEGYRGY
jgi:hypothetical protein